MQQSERYSVNNDINCWNCSHIQSQRPNSQNFSAITEFLHNKYCVYCWNDSEIQSQSSNSQNVPVIGKAYSHWIQTCWNHFEIQSQRV